MEANKIAITDEALRRGAEEGMDGFLKVFIDKYLEVTGGVVNAETMPLLNGYQHSLLGYHFLREEINEGGFVQLIQNGFGPYIFDNPFAKAMRQFGAKEFAKLIYSAKKIYDENRADLEKDRDDEEFMAMYEQYKSAANITVFFRKQKLFPGIFLFAGCFRFGGNTLLLCRHENKTGTHRHSRRHCFICRVRKMKFPV